ATPGSRLWVPLMYRLAAKIRLPALANWLRSHAEARVHLHHALDGIDLTLVRGEALRIIGPNGSGKSTLLQFVAGVLEPTAGEVLGISGHNGSAKSSPLRLVAGVLEPTAGEVEVHGRVAALLELGSGFNPELTGRENVRVNAAILGLTPAQVRDRMDDIIAFA